PLSTDEVFDVNVARLVVSVKTQELISELVSSGDLDSMSGEALEERAKLRCLKEAAVRAVYQRVPEIIDTDIRLSVQRLRWMAEAKGKASVLDVQDDRPTDGELSAARTEAPRFALPSPPVPEPRAALAPRPPTRPLVSDAESQRIQDEMNRAFRKNVAAA